jgi:stage II sporulation protein AA (anti-sigma F factor antagonist)
METEEDMKKKPGTNRNNVRVLDLSGGLTVSTVENLKKEVSKAAKGNEEEIVLNFESVNRVDSSGLGAIISCYVTLHRKKKRLSLVNLNDKIREVFFYTHLSKIINIYKGLEEVAA